MSDMIRSGSYDKLRFYFEEETCVLDTAQEIIWDNSVSLKINRVRGGHHFL